MEYWNAGVLEYENLQPFACLSAEAFAKADAERVAHRANCYRKNHIKKMRLVVPPSAGNPRYVII